MQEPDRRHIIDYDGMGDFTRFRTRSTKEYVSLENEVRRSFKKFIEYFSSKDSDKSVKN